MNKMVKWVKNNPLTTIGIGIGALYLSNRYGGISGLGKAGMLGDEDDVSSGHGFQQTGYTGKHAFGNPEPIHPMPSGPKISYRAEDHEQPMMMDPIYEAAKRPRDASMFQPASVRNMDIETTVAQGFESTVFAGIDNVHMF